MRKTRALLTAPIVALLVAGLPAFGSVSMGAPKLTDAQSACAPEKGVVNITYAAWNTDFAGAVKAFNATHPSIHVTFELTTFRDYQNLSLIHIYRSPIRHRSQTRQRDPAAL